MNAFLSNVYRHEVSFPVMYRSNGTGSTHHVSDVTWTHFCWTIIILCQTKVNFIMTYGNCTEWHYLKLVWKTEIAFVEKCVVSCLFSSSDIFKLFQNCAFIYFALNIFYLSFLGDFCVQLPTSHSWRILFLPRKQVRNWSDFDSLLRMTCSSVLSFNRVFPNLFFTVPTSTFCCDLKAYHMKDRVIVKKHSFVELESNQLRKTKPLCFQFQWLFPSFVFFLLQRFPQVSTHDRTYRLSEHIFDQRSISNPG